MRRTSRILIAALALPMGLAAGCGSDPAAPPAAAPTSALSSTAAMTSAATTSGSASDGTTATDPGVATTDMPDAPGSTGDAAPIEASTSSDAATESTGVTTPTVKVKETGTFDTVEYDGGTGSLVVTATSWSKDSGDRLFEADKGVRKVALTVTGLTDEVTAKYQYVQIRDESGTIYDADVFGFGKGGPPGKKELAPGDTWEATLYFDAPKDAKTLVFTLPNEEPIAVVELG